MRGFRFQNANIEKSQKRQRRTVVRFRSSRKRRRGLLLMIMSATAVQNFHGNNSRRVETSVLKRDSTSIPQRGMRVSSLSRPVTWRRAPRSLIRGPTLMVSRRRVSCRWRGQCMHSGQRVNPEGYSPCVTVAFAPQDRREGKWPTRTGGSSRVQIVGCKSSSHSR